MQGTQLSPAAMLDLLTYCTICGMTTCDTCMCKTVEKFSANLDVLGVDCSEPHRVRLNVCPNCLTGPHFFARAQIESGFEITDIAELLDGL